MSRISLDSIKQPIDKELVVFEQRFREAMASKVALLDTIMGYIVKRKGKQIRPIFTLLSARMFGEINPSSYRGAALVELLHTATLVHDDVVDDSYMRRGFFSINALWKNKIAVLVGDYLLSKGLLLAVENKDFHLLEIVSHAVRKMSEGELLQIEKSRSLNLSEEIYFDIINKKTASLIAACCGIGAASNLPAGDERVEKMQKFGELVGLAFQIKDDLFDYGTDDVGKPLGIDIKEKKLTLPVIYAINHATDSDRRFLINTIKNHHKDKQKVQQVIAMVKTSGGIEYTRKKMNEIKDEAINLLHSFEQNEAAEKLGQLVSFVIERKK